MALILKDRVKETSVTSGTGTIDLDGAVAGFEGFVSAVGNGNVCYYAIQDADGIAWEVGVGTITDATPDTLTRNTILASSNADSVVSLSTGTHNVFLTYPAEKSVYRNLNDQVVLTASGVIFSDATVQTTAAVDTTYTAGTGLSLSGTEFHTANTGNFQQLTFNDGVVRIGTSAAVDSISCTRSEFMGDEAGKGASGITDSQFFGSEAGSQAENNTHISAIGSTAGAGASGCSDSQFFGRSAGNAAIGCDTVFMGGRNAGAGSLNSVHSVMIGEYAGSLSTNVEFSNLIGYFAGESSSGHHNNYIGFQAGYNADGYNNLEIVNSGANTSILNNTNNKVHIQKLITGDSSTRRIAVGNVGSSNLNPTATLEIVSQNVSDTGLYVHNLVIAQTGITLLDNTPAVTTDKLYNVGGTLFFNGSGYLTSHPSIAGASSSNNSGRTYIQDLFFDSNGHVTGVSTATETVTDTNTTYTAGDGLDLVTTTFSVDDTVARSGGNIGQFVNDSGYLNVHPTISAASSSNNSGRTYIQDVLVDSNGHVTGLATATETVTDTTYTAGTGLQLAGTTFNIQDDYLKNNADDTTTGTITAGGFSTTGVITVGQAFKSNNKSNSDGGTITFDLDVSNFHTVTLGGNRTLALSNADEGQKFAIRLQQDATGSRTVTWFSTIKWPDGVAPTLSSTGNKADLFGFVCTSGGQYDGFGIGYNL